MLKLDLLPAHYAIARRNRKVLFMSIPLLVLVVLGWLGYLAHINSTINGTQAELDETKTKADAVRKLQGETKARQDELAPIQAKISFVQQADQSGGQFWDRFHQLNRYIYDRAVVSSFSITPPASVSFTAEVETTEDAARFILNMVRCPYITSFSFSAPTTMEGGAIEGIPGAAAAGAAGGAPGGAAGGPPAGPGGPEAGGAPGGATPTAGAGAGPIRFTVSCTLKQPISIPSPPAAGGGAAPGGPGGAPGGPGGPGGPPADAGGPPPGDGGGGGEA